ncbi:ergothioneine biosynthesis protein EgtB [Gloeobacter morelensis]|uniref:Ergothioneine biosynthesis protein EgtB n=1 Tax=Gloeobacter morelensis MG652769 TaxID=2781736 RepID=A0ABY3PP51_9CYAN|nr:ergothioneine biosynthesis protein EgtB [Gloeobacter morelensis]UFP95483.1 ergothioneine biosynthesis protein EgtB [Gloeobacter morelensis MG652769]
MVQEPVQIAAKSARFLPQRLFATREATLFLLAGVEREQLCCQVHPDYSPVGWHLGHIAFTEGLWILERCAGLPRPAPEFGRIFAVDALPKAERTSLPATAEIYGYVRQVREQVLACLERDPGLAAEARLWHFLVQHESQHAETMCWLLQLLAPPAAGEAVFSGADTDEMIRVEPGEALSGSDADEALDNERPSRRVHLEGYWIDRYPVTQRQFQAFIDAGGYGEPHFWSASGWRWLSEYAVHRPLYWSAPDDRPVMGVSYFEAEAYARFARKRLPTEAEWEKAARYDPTRGTFRTYPWGEVPPEAGRPTDRRAAVGTHPAGRSALGLDDLLGNVWEWTATWFYPYPGFVSYPYPGYSAAYFDDGHRVLKGGSWVSGPAVLRPSFRNWYEPDQRVPFAGFRCARSL